MIYTNRINENINVSVVRLISVNGEQIGIIDTNKALEKAKKENMDLVEINSDTNPPVCRLMNYDKFLYKKYKSIKEQRKKQKILQTKEIKFRPNTDTRDYQIKLRNLTNFLKDGNKIKITLKFKGREVIHQDIGIKMLNNIRDNLSELSTVEYYSNKIENKQMIMILAPKL